MKVFGHYDQAALEVKFDGGSRNSELNAVRGSRAVDIETEVAQVRATATVQLDLAYGVHAREKQSTAFQRRLRTRRCWLSSSAAIVRYLGRRCAHRRHARQPAASEKRQGTNSPLGSLA